MKTLTLTADLSTIKADDTERLGLPSASAAPRLANCPGSWRMEMNQPQLTKYADSADAGTRIHNFLAGNHGETLNAEERATAESLQAAATHVSEAWKDSLPHDEGLSMETSIEERWFIHAGIVPVTSGKWDVLVQSGNHFLLLDYKTGWQELPPIRHNLQMRVYALLVFQKHPEAESISVAIVRPGDEENEKSFFFTYTRTDLESAWFWWQNVLNAVFAENPPIVSGEHCTFCKAQYTCPARIVELVGFHARPELSMLWESLTLSERSDLFIAWKAAERVGKSIAEKVREDLESGITIPGLRIGKGKTTREVDDAQAAYTRVTREGLTHEQFMESVTVSFAQLRDKLTAHKGWKKKDGTENALAVLSGCVTEHTTKGSIEIL